MEGCALKRGPKKSSVPPRPSRPTGLEYSKPARQASNALVDDGLRSLEEGDFEKAADFFQEAIALDTTNGAAYYHLAFIRLKQGEPSEARGLLEQAEHLLAGEKAWEERLKDLRVELGEM